MEMTELLCTGVRKRCKTEVLCVVNGGDMKDGRTMVVKSLAKVNHTSQNWTRRPLRSLVYSLIQQHCGNEGNNL